MITVRWFRVVAVVEAVSFLALLGASFAKRALDVPGLVPVVGPVHGLIFLGYFTFVVLLREEMGWSTVKTIGIIAAAVVPLGGIVVERRVLHGAVPGAAADPATPGTDPA